MSCLRADAKTVLVLSKNIFNMGLFDDLKKCDQVSITESDAIKGRSVYEKVKRRILKKLGLVDIKRFQRTTNINLKSNKCKCIILDSGALACYPIRFLLYIKRKYQIKIVLLVLNSWDASSPNITRYRKEILSDIWDGVYSFDKKDSERFNWHYIGLNYFSVQDLPQSEVKNDLYFVGGLKGNRESMITRIFDECTNRGIHCYMDIYCSKSHDLGSMVSIPKSANFKQRGTWIPYRDVLKKIAESNCILEILQENQHTQSVRYFEAIAYNKKLLTNNPNIIHMPFYDERYMRYFEKIESIDMGWIKRKDTINYDYKGEFSPIKLLMQIDMILDAQARDVEE